MTPQQILACVLGAWRALDRARAGANCGANLGAGDAVWRATQGAGNDEWRRNSPRPNAGPTQSPTGS